MWVQSYQKTKGKMVIGNLYTSVITLNVNGLDSPMKRHRVADWIRKQNPILCCL